MVISLLQKYNDMAAAGTPLGIKSAFCHDHLSVRANDLAFPHLLWLAVLYRKFTSGQASGYKRCD